jgi:hypothetical protein
MGALSMRPIAPLLSDSSHDLWWGMVIGGFVVVLAVAALLTILVLEVRTIDRRVASVKETLMAAEQNTQDAALIGVTAGGVEAVLAEGLQHHLFLGRVLGKVRM